MAQTQRISWTSTAPSTEYRYGADIIAQSQAGNYSTVRVSATAYNRGNTSSFSGNSGSHTCAIDGQSGGAVRSGTMASGFATGAVRWDVSADITINHDAAGNLSAVTLRQTVTGWFSRVDTASFGGFPRIPKPASAPGTPSFSEVLPTSVRVTWDASLDDGGSAVTGYLLRYWPNAEGTGAYTDFSVENNLSRVVTDLTPGLNHRFVVYAANGSHGVYSPASSAAVVRTLSGMWVKWLGVWRRAAPYVKFNGAWVAASVFIREAGVWRRGG
jgi:Fibronectin type III domain